MGVFGDKLRREREMRGITLAEMAESTKISKRWLQALEDEEFEILPGGVFNRGFVRAYARFLGINDEQAVSDYIAASNEPEPPEDKFPLDVHQIKKDSPPLNPRRSYVPVLLAILALVGVVGGWTAWVKHKPWQKSASDPHPATHAAPVNQPVSANNTASPSVAASSIEGKSSTATADPSVPKSNAKGPDRKSDVPDKTPAEAEGNPKQATSDRDQDLSNSFNVVIKARQDSWISIVADGRPLWMGTMNAHSQRSITAGKELVLRTGNAAGIEVSYNGKALGALGKENQVRTFTFNTFGLQQ